MATFLNSDKTLSGDGARLVEWLEAQCDYAEGLPLDESTNYLNTLSGPIRQYYINVYKLKSHTPVQWVEEFGKSWAKDAWRIMEFVEAQMAQAQAQQQTADKTNQIADQLTALGERLAVVEAENAALKAASAKKPAKNDKPVEDAPEGDESEA